MDDRDHGEPPFGRPGREREQPVDGVAGDRGIGHADEITELIDVGVPLVGLPFAVAVDEFAEGGGGLHAVFTE